MEGRKNCTSFQSTSLARHLTGTHAGGALSSVGHVSGQHFGSMLPHMVLQNRSCALNGHMSYFYPAFATCENFLCSCLEIGLCKLVPDELTGL